MDAFWLALASLIVVIGPWKAAIVFAERTRVLPLIERRLVAVVVCAVVPIEMKTRLQTILTLARMNRAMPT